MNPLNALRPQYVFNPTQAWRRLTRMQPRDGTVWLAWGLPIRVELDWFMRADIANHGVFDMIVPEAIARLLDRGELAIDVGANIGQNCSIMALVAGPKGDVLAFEPHPVLAAQLRANVERWQPFRTASIRVLDQAASARNGLGPLYEPIGFEDNPGRATLQPQTGGVSSHVVEMTTLDDAIGEERAVGVLKLDVEGHEPEVLRGAERMLSRRQIRDIIFEDLDRSGEAARILERAGYRVFALTAGWWKPRLVDGGAVTQSLSGFSDNYLATLDPSRAQRRFARLGWRCLRLRPM